MGLDGSFPFFVFAFSLSFLCLHSFLFALVFFAFLPVSFVQRKRPAICRKKGEFYSDPVCTDPDQNFPKESGCTPRGSCNITLLIGKSQKGRGQSISCDLGGGGGNVL